MKTPVWRSVNSIWNFESFFKQINSQLANLMSQRIFFFFFINTSHKKLTCLVDDDDLTFFFVFVFYYPRHLSLDLAFIQNQIWFAAAAKKKNHGFIFLFFIIYLFSWSLFLTLFPAPDSTLYDEIKEKK